MSLGSGTDNIAYDPEIADLIAREFAADAGRRLPPGDLIAAVTAIRKRGLLDTVDKPSEDTQDVGFDDMDLATG